MFGRLINSTPSRFQSWKSLFVCRGNEIHRLYSPISSYNCTFIRSMSNGPKTTEISKGWDGKKIRNIGIMAHIDAGKTTTTERMLFHAGFTKHIGDVDDGDTVMDYMEQERNRGITITSAAITFYWRQHRLNLIDTPGHVDFTVEVERALRVLDGAVTILDASAGVEAQTLTVWRQADKYKIPRLIFLNKMDKPAASFIKSLKSIREKLNIQPLVLQLPVGEGKNYNGHVDLVAKEMVTWPPESQQSNGVKFIKSEFPDSAARSRIELIDQLAELDEVLAESVLNSSGYDKISADEIRSSIRRLTSSCHVVPVLCGTSLKNTGVQALMDAVVDFLPSSIEKRDETAEYFGDSLSALVFKIIHDKQRGPLTFLRLYSGRIQSGTNLYNVDRKISEKSTRLLRAYADEYKDIESAHSGDIVLVTGLKESMTGDTLCSSYKSMERARARLCSDAGVDYTDHSPLPLLDAMDVPDPVFLCTIEPPSLAVQKDLENALRCLQREDPSFHVHVDADSGQTVLSGMGELHLEIIQDRIRSEYGIEADLGPLHISYREAISEETHHECTLERSMGDKLQRARMKLALLPRECGAPRGVTVVHTKDNDLDKIKRPYLKAVESGVLSALKQGPLLGFPVLDVEVELHEFEYRPGTSLAFISACASDTVHAALNKISITLLEPIMDLRISTDEEYLHVTLADLSRRRAAIQEIDSVDNERIVTCQVPLSELLGYSTVLRTITSGRASFSMHVHSYQPMTPDEQQKAVQRVTGFL